jgi:hypothetical protein
LIKVLALESKWGILQLGNLVQKSALILGKILGIMWIEILVRDLQRVLG